MKHLLDYAYDTNPTNDVALEQTDKHKAIPIQGLACIAAIPPLCAYAVLVANQNAALNGITTKEYVEKLIFADQAARSKIAAME